MILFSSSSKTVSLHLTLGRGYVPCTAGCEQSEWEPVELSLPKATESVD